MPPKFLQIINAMEYFKKVFPEDACLYLYSAKENIYALPGEKFDLKVKTGTPFEELKESVAYRSLKSGKVIREERGADVLGIAYIATACPVYDGDEVIGVLSAGFSNQKNDTLRRSSSELGGAVQEVSSTAKEMMRASDNVTKRLQELSEQAETVKKEIAAISEILSLVKNIARQSNILGLNASIEAARTGEHGKGFAFVATEIRKLAKNSDQSVNQIEEQLELIVQSVEKMNDSTNQISAFTEEHHAGMEELGATFDHIGKMAEALLYVSKVN